MTNSFDTGFSTDASAFAGAMKDSQENLKKMQEQMRELEGHARRFAGDLRRGVVEAVFSGEKLDKVFKRAALGFAKNLLNSALKPIEQGIGDLLSSMIRNAFAGSFGGGQKAGLGAGGIPFLNFFADGGVLGSPAMFPLGKGLGLAGEAGPEAILPLARDLSGRLGVRSSGNDGGGMIVNFSVNATDAESFSRSETQIAAMLSRAVSRGQRNL